MFKRYIFAAPSKPENVSATILNPTLVEVSWSPPREINGDSVWYEIHWQTEGDSNGIRQKGEQIVPSPTLKDSTNNYYAQLYKLSPNETYSIWIRAHSQTNESSMDSNDSVIASSDSNSVKITTFPEPHDIVLLNCTAHDLHIKSNVYLYAKHYILQYTYLISNDWTDITNDLVTLINDTMFISIENLKPKSQYKIRMVLIYPNSPELYVWPTESRFIFETLGNIK